MRGKGPQKDVGVPNRVDQRLLHHVAGAANPCIDQLLAGRGEVAG
jgi:hypothetical protein